MEQEKEETIKKIDDFLKSKRNDIPDNVLRRCLNENWFSDTLAWLMDPKSDHGLGTAFIKLFVEKVAKKRSSNSTNPHRASYLKWGKSGSGRASTSLHLSNSTSLREFYLSQSINKKDPTGQLYCDVVLMDLDSQDSIILVIENKLFTINSKTQLSDYYKVVEKKFSKVKKREYVYLTLSGDDPVSYGKNSHLNKQWVCLSWLCDIKEILEKLDGKLDIKVREFLQLLQYLESITKNALTISSALRDIILDVASDCLFEELRRLLKKGEWKRLRSNKISHTSVKTRLKFSLLPNYYVTIQGMDGKNPKYEKILIPFGAHPDQIFNLFDIAAREIYHRHFNDYKLYLNDNRKLTKTISATKTKYKYILQFIHDNRYQLQVLLQSNKTIRDEQKIFIEQNESGAS
jgi:hypothetical protein